MYNYRIKALISTFPKNSIDGLLVTKPENIFYLTSFMGNGTALIINPKKCVVVTDFIYAEAATRFFRNFDVLIVKEKDLFEKYINSALDKYKIKRLGFESRFMHCAQYKKMKKKIKRAHLITTENLVECLREIKEAGEILSLKRSLVITAKIFKSVKKSLRPDITELAVSKDIKEGFIKNGADGFSFEPIVATQPSSSQPHYAPRQKKLGRNKAILIDMGAKLAGYNSDLTRMCILGKINSKFKYLYDILGVAQKLAIERIKPGVRISDIDSAVRQHIVNKGLGNFFGHSLGHGIGLEIHEKPAISCSNKDILKEGMVFTIEPGIYIPGYGGMRIEDMIRVTKRGCEVLTIDIDKSI